MKRLIIFILAVVMGIGSFAQQKNTKSERKKERQQRVNALIKQEEEGALIYNKQSIFGIQLRTDGYGLFYEMGRMKTRRKSNIYTAELCEIKDPKEEKTPTNFLAITNPYVYGKINNFYPFKLGFGQQYLLGQKGNKNGVAVTASYQGGLSLGLLRPYYLEIQDSSGALVKVKFNPNDTAQFLDGSKIRGSAGITKGWSEIKLKPGAFAKAAIRFDWGRYNEIVYGVEVGLSVEAYAQKIPILLYAKQKQFFFQGHLALVFGRRR